MESLLVNLQEVWLSIPFNIIFLIPLLFIVLIAIHLYSLSRGKKELLKVVDSKVKIFEKAFDISEDAMLILSDKNEIVYANRTMKKLLSLGEDFMFKPLIKMPKIEVKTKWVSLDELINLEYTKSDDRMLSYLQVNLSVRMSDENIPINLYLDSSPLGVKDNMWCNIISMHDLRQKKKQQVIGYRHQLTGVPNQAQMTDDLTALYSKIHLKDQKLALVLIDIDDFSTLRSIVGYEQINVILRKLATYLQSISTKLDISVYHTYYNNFLLTLSNVDSNVEILEFVHEVQKELATFYKLKDVKLHLTASVGISVYPESGSTKNLLDRTYKALARAQELGEGRIHVYEDEEQSHDYDE